MPVAALTNALPDQKGFGATYVSMLSARDQLRAENEKKLQPVDLILKEHLKSMNHAEFCDY